MMMKSFNQLVLDLDETLIHYEESSEGGQFLLRPYVQRFLKKMNQYFEIIIFTAAMKEYADWIIDRIDTSEVVKYRMYRRDTTQFNQMFIKDLRKLNRDLKRILILDNNPENFCFQPDNGIV
jgi:Dullard-like phosphatase family protein